MNEKIPTKRERGCLLTTVLVLSLLGAVFNAFFAGSYAVVNAPQRLNELEYWLFVVFLVVSIFAIYSIFVTFKMKKRGAIGLLIAMAITIAFLLWGALDEEPASDAAKSGVMWMLIMAAGCFVCSIIVALHLKKMD